MKKIYLMLFACMLMATASFAQLTGGTTYPVNGVSSPPTSFSTIQDAATYLKANGVTGTGNIILELQSGYNPAAEPATGILIEAMPGTNSARRVIFRPGAGFSTTISLAVSGNASVNFMKAGFVTIDGRQGGAGATNSLAITNTNTGTVDSTSALKFGNDTRFCEVIYCDLSASNKALNYGGVVLFSKGAVSGCSDNKLYKCNIDGKGLVLKGIHSRGTGNVTPTTQNQFDTVRACNIYDYFNLSNVYGVYLQEFNTDWTIDSNNVYQTVSRNFTTAGNCILYGILCGVSWTSDEHYIADNFIGGNAPLAAGTLAIQSTGSNAIGFFGIATNSGGTNQLVYRNTVRNVTVNYASSLGSFANNAIQEFVGFAGVGYVYNNIIDNISITNTAGSAITYPIEVTNQSGSNTNIYGNFFTYDNKVSNITASCGPLATHSAVIYGIRLDANSGSGVTSGQVIPYNEVVGNKISNLSATSSTLISTGSAVRGISSGYTQTTAGSSQLAMSMYLQEDTVTALTTNSANTSVSAPGAIGILANAGGTIALIDTVPIFNNVVSNIANTNNTDINNAVVGILGNNIAYFIDSNKVSDIRNAALGLTGRPNVFGINVRSVVRGSVVSNNQVALGNAQNNNLQVYGIINNTNSTDSLKLRYNSVLISGTPTVGAYNSSAIYRGSDTLTPVIAVKTPMLVTDNLCINKRSGGTGIHSSIASQSSAATVAFSGNYNTFISSTAATMGRWGLSNYDLAAWRTNTLNDTNSYYAQSNPTTNFSVNPAVVNVDNLFSDVAYELSGNMAVNTSNPEAWLLNGKGIAIPGSGAGRSLVIGTPTDIGYNEFNVAGGNLPPNLFISAPPAPSTTTSYIFAGRKIGDIIWGASVPASVNWKYYSGTPGPATTGAVINSYSDVPATGTGPLAYSIKQYYTLAEQNQIPDANLRGLKKEVGVPWYNIGGTPGIDADGKFVTSTGLTNFSQFTLKDVNNLTIPVTLLNFTAQRTGKVNVLNWSTSQEINTKNFVIEHSTDGRNFSDIGTVTAVGNSSTVRNYTFTHSNPVVGINYYRLRIVDKDNNYKNSLVRSVRNEGIADVAVYPNPVKDMMTVSISADKAGVGTMMITDISGKVIYSSKINVNQGANNLPVDLKNAAAGSYMIKVQLSDDYVVKKFEKLQ